MVLSAAGCGCLKEETVSMGEFSSKNIAVRAAIPQLATIIDRCPRAEVYRIMWVGAGDAEGSQNRHSVLYDRPHKRIGYEDDFLSGISGKAYSADDAAIHTVAQRGGMLEDFDEQAPGSKSKE
jgi:hypothetical protein